MSRALRIALAIALLVAAIAAGLYVWRESHPPLLSVPAAAEAPAPAAPQGPRHPLLPLPPKPEEKPLPPLGASDPEVRDALSEALGALSLEHLVFDGFIRRVVATLDNLPREKYAARLSPVRPVPGLPITSGGGDDLLLAPRNSARYAPYVAAFEATDTERLAALYQRYYPLFQRAYEDLGYPQGYFNDRLVEVIDHLLETPEPPGAIRLTQPKVLYEFADAELEQRSAGQKAMMRLGSDNAAKVKAKLREIRARVAHAP